jgi:pyridoxamine 5'-phosphate oxidase family protein
LKAQGRLRSTRIEVGGRNFGQAKKYRKIRANPRGAIVIDDLAGITPRKGSIEVRGMAVLEDGGGSPVASDQPWARITPERIARRGID